MICPKRYCNAAQETRILASRVDDSVIKRILFEIASSYDRLAVSLREKPME
jgi:hypothetical protein